MMSLFALVFMLLLSGMANDALAQETVPQQDFDNLMVALDSSSAHMTELQAREDLMAENVRVVRTSDLLLESDNETVLNQTLEMNSENITELRAALSANEPILGALEASQTTLDDVIAVHVTDEGLATVYVQDEYVLDE